MGEPVLRLVVPDEPGRGPDGRDAAGWPAPPVSGPAGSATSPAPGPAEGATSAAPAGATAPATNGATSGATTGATFPAAPAAGNTVPAPAAAGGAGGQGDGEAGPGPLEPYGREMTWPERAGRLVRHWWAMAHQDAARPGGFWHGVWHGKPDSLAEVHAYTRDRAWVPEGHEGALIPAVGAAYGHTIAKGGAALGLFIAWVTARMLRLGLFCLVAGVITVLIICFG